MSSSFPFNQTVAAFSPIIGNYCGSTVIVAAYSSGYSLSQIQVNQSKSSSTQLAFDYNCIGNLENSGNSTSALAFLTNAANQANSTQYLLAGSNDSSDAGLWLLSVEIPQDASNLAASSLSTATAVTTGFDAGIASICYDPQATTTNNLFVAQSNGNIIAYSVTFPTTFTAANTKTTATNLLVNGGYSLAMLASGSLVLYAPSYDVLWSTPNYSGSNNTGTFSPDVVSSFQGINLTIRMYQQGNYGGDGVVDSVWSSQWLPYSPTGTKEGDQFYLALGNNGSLAIINLGNVVVGYLNQGTGDCTSWVCVGAGNYLVSTGSLSAPSFTKNFYNKTLSSASGGQIQVVPLYQAGQATVYLVTGESDSGTSGLYYFTADGLTNSSGLTIVCELDSPCVAIAVSGTTVYLAKENELYVGTWNNGSIPFSSIWSTSTQTITSLTFSPCNLPQGATIIYDQGALFIGTYGNSTSNTPGVGCVYAYNVKTGSVQPINTGITGETNSVLSDLSGFVLVTSGNTALTVLNPNNVSAQLETESVLLIPNEVEPSKKFSLLDFLTSVAALAFSILTLQPEASAVAIAGVVAASAGVAETAP